MVLEGLAKPEKKDIGGCVRCSVFRARVELEHRLGCRSRALSCNSSMLSARIEAVKTLGGAQRIPVWNTLQTLKARVYDGRSGRTRPVICGKVLR